MTDIQKPKTLSLKKTVSVSDVEQSFSHGRKKTVKVEVRKKRTFTRGDDGRMALEPGMEPHFEDEIVATTPSPAAIAPSFDDGLTDSERQARLKALQHAESNREQETERRTREAEEANRRREDEKRRKIETDEARAKLDAELQAREAIERAKTVEASTPATATATPAPAAPETEEAKASRLLKTQTGKLILKTDGKSRKDEEEEAQQKAKDKKTRLADEKRRAGGKLTLTQALASGDGDSEAGRTRSLASVRRAREKARRQEMGSSTEKVYREVTIPETITVQELANRMTERATDVIRGLMKMGMMATTNDVIDADTAELIVSEFGHTPKRVTEADIENVLLADDQDTPASLRPRAPVVTIMGHVDHGKTSLLDALRQTDVAAGESGGITQHIGAYRVKLKNDQHITFLDTPGHAAFTAMRLRGATATDIVVLVVAADDGIMEQTVEAINHARAAGVPIIVAINKVDKPQANPMRVATELLQHGLVPESLGGDIITVEVSAKMKTGLDALEETILLQAEILELKANPARKASGVVIESRMDKTRGPIATLLVKRGTLRVGDVILAGSTTGRVRAMMNERGKHLDEATPSVPVEITGLEEAPAAGDNFAVVDTERQAREIAEYREKRGKDLSDASRRRGSLEHLFSKAAGSGLKELPIIIKADVHGSVEAIIGSLNKLAHEEVAVKVLHGGVGAITESDIMLAKASGALILGFNVRATANAKSLSEHEHITLRYYSIIYNLVDDVKLMLTDMLAPEVKENHLGNATIREVFNLTKFGKVAGCFVTEGVIRRGAGVRLLRDNIVIHEGKLKTLKRFKDDAKEVASNFECGMAFENYEDMKVGDIIEAFETVEEKREL
jgi:translation initiation factor IF-2